MNLLVRLNVALGGAFLLAGLGLSFACSRLLDANARQELIREAGLMMESAVATREYTSDEILPLLNVGMKTEFLPQSVPSYAATQNFLKLHQQHPDYAYKEATLNPTNPRDRAMDWESDLIHQFRNTAQLKEIVGERDTPIGRTVYLARPIRVEAACLTCHSLPQAAPATLIARYGSNNGFGWQPKEVVGAQVVSVPLAAATVNAQRTLHAMIIAIVSTYAVLLAFANGLLFWLVVRPLRRVIRVADALSRGDPTHEDFPMRGARELNMLGLAFNRLRVSLEKTMKRLQP
jgi:HAMP domain-containing protein